MVISPKSLKKSTCFDKKCEKSTVPTRAVSCGADQSDNDVMWKGENRGLLN